MNNDAPHLKSPKNLNRRAALGRPAIKLLGGGGGGGGGELQLVCGRPNHDKFLKAFHLLKNKSIVIQTLSEKIPLSKKRNLNSL